MSIVAGFMNSPWESMENRVNDTSEFAERILIEGYRNMPFHKKIAQVSALTQMVQKLALSRIRSQYGEISEQEQRLRLAALWLPRSTMIRLFNWDPEIKGY